MFFPTAAVCNKPPSPLSIPAVTYRFLPVSARGKAGPRLSPFRSIHSDRRRAPGVSQLALHHGRFYCYPIQVHANYGNTYFAVSKGSQRILNLHFHANFLLCFALVLTLILQMTGNRTEILFSLTTDFLTRAMEYKFYSSHIEESSSFGSAFICMFYTHPKDVYFISQSVPIGT